MPERTLIIFKPDAVQRQLCGRILTRFEQKGLQLIAAKLLTIPQAQAETHYGIHKGKPFYESVIKYITSGPVMVCVFQADRAIAIARKLMGATFGYDAEPGTIRGDFGCSRGFNLIHGSDSPEAAATEIKLYFSDDEIVSYEISQQHWLYGDE